jgi:ABC-type branched-subunit amino acid transport system permease subunit
MVGMVISIFLYFFLARYTEISMIIQGIILVGIMLLAPHGIVGALRNTRPYRFLLGKEIPAGLKKTSSLSET